MRKLLIATASCFGLLAPMAALAQDAQPALQPAMTTNNPNHLICHYSYFEGMVVRHRDCRTQFEWDRMRHETQQQITDLQLRSLTMK